METFFNSFLLVFAGEMGDKTQLLALVLAARFRKPYTVLLGVFIATVLNHALASWAGDWISSLLSPSALKWSLAATFFIFSAWLLVPDKETEVSAKPGHGALVTTIVAFFLAEMGDKTQLATIALGAHYSDVFIVTAGTTVGMLASNALAIFLGHRLLARIPMKWVRIFASTLFLLFGILIVLNF